MPASEYGILPPELQCRPVECRWADKQGFIMRFTIRDLLWFMAVAGIGLAWHFTAQRSTRLESRLESAQRRIAGLMVQNETVANESATNLATADALATAFRNAELSEAQRCSIRQLFAEELHRQGVKIEHSQ